MAQTRTVGLVAVGVDRTGVLPDLNGAAAGDVRRVSDWLRSQQPFNVTAIIKELTDENGAKVSAHDVRDAVSDILARGDLDLLVLYFAGHGIVKSGFDEQVLLSDVGRYKDEAIAVAPTALNAAYCSVPHVVLISDACRSPVDPFGPLGTVAGGPVVDRGPVTGIRKSKVDLFYATEPSQTAKQVAGVGFFTKMLVQTLLNPPADVCDSWPGLPPGVVVVPTWELDTYLSYEIPVRASKETPPFNQSPDFTVTSRQPQFLGYAKAVAAAPAAARRGGIRDFANDDATDLEKNVTSKRQALTDVTKNLNTFAFDSMVPVRATVELAGLLDHTGSYVGSDRGRQAFETRTGYTIIGDDVEVALLSNGRVAELAPFSAETRSRDIRLYPTPFERKRQSDRGSMIVMFRGGTASILPVLPGYIGTVHVREGRMVSLSFEVSSQLRSTLKETEKEREMFAGRRAVASALAATGKLHRLAPAEGASYASFLRQSKRADPTLGIYASYAYALSGDDRGAQSVFQWFQQYGSLDPDTGIRPSPVPFDVVMLARKLTRETAMRPPGLAPFCPLMTLGWSVMPSFPMKDVLHDEIIKAGKHRLNAEWTTFRCQDIRSLVAAFERGDIQ